MNKLILGTLFLFVSMIRLPAADALALIGYTEPVSKQDDIMKVWITAASSTQIEYKTTPQSLNRNRIKLQAFTLHQCSIFDLIMCPRNAVHEILKILHQNGAVKSVVIFVIF